MSLATKTFKNKIAKYILLRWKELELYYYYFLIEVLTNSSVIVAIDYIITSPTEN